MAVTKRSRRKKPPPFGEQLQGLRKKRGLSLAGVETAAGAHGLTRQAVSRIERGEREPSFGALVALAYALEVRIVFDERGVVIVPDTAAA
jgi:transcriptional regulator with XRE-family HTH domain